MKKRLSIVALTVVASMLVSYVTTFAAISNNYSAPPVNPPDGQHPRVLFTADDVPSLQAVLESDDMQNSSARTWFRRRRDNVPGVDNGGGDCSDADHGWNQKRLGNIEAKAFSYAVEGNIDKGNTALEYMNLYLDTIDLSKAGDVTETSRAAGEIMLIASEVYDWCYDLMSAQERTEFINKVETKLCSRLEIGWPPVKQGSITSHGSEAQLLRDSLAFAIATYDERPDIWNAVAGRFYQEYVPVRNHFNPAQYNLQGDTYGLYRHRWDAWAYLLITGMGAPSPYESVEDLYKTAYQGIYTRRPDGQFFRDGDSANDSSYSSPFSRWKFFHDVFMIDSAIGNDPYIKDEWSRDNSEYTSFYEDTAMLQLIVNKADVAPKSRYNLPLTKFFKAPANIVSARTSWDEGANSNTAVALMKIGGDVVNNHQHLDAGSFQLYYKGILASDSGIYNGANSNDTGSGASGYFSDHHEYYETKTVAHNSMLVYDPNEADTYREHFWSTPEINMNRANCTDGGQQSVNKAKEPLNLSQVGTVASVVSHEVDQTNPNKPSYTYIKGDLTDAYSSKISDYKRSFMFLNLGRDDVPAALVVFDKVTASKASFKKTWLLHGQEEPIINGNQTVFKRTYGDDNGQYNGKMTVDTIVPANPSITKVGGNGKYSYIGGAVNRSYEATESNTETDEGNTWRIEVSPSVQNTTDQFLNVIQVSEADKNNYLPTTKIDTTECYGVKIADRVVTFAKNGNEMSGDFTLTALGGTTEYTICDMKKGRWTVNGTQYIANEDGNVLHFTDSSASGTALNFHYVGGLAGTGLSYTNYEGEPTNIDYVELFVDGETYATETMARLDENGKVLVAVDDICDILDVNSSISGDTVTFSKNGKTSKMTVGQATFVAGDKTIDRSDEATPVKIDGVFFVSPTTLASYYLGSTGYNKYLRELTITPSVYDGEMCVEYSIDGENYTEIPAFNPAITDYNIELPNQITNVKVRVKNSQGTQYFSNLNSSSLHPGQSDEFPWTEIAWSGSQYQYSLERFLSDGVNMTEASLPIKNNYGISKMYYTDITGNETVYSMSFHSVNPSIVDFSNNIANSSGASVRPIYVNGGAAWNDNGSILDTRISASNTRLWTLGNISPSLQGASMFILPATDMDTDRMCGTSPSRTTLFDFKADCPGRVVVLLSVPANENSGFITNGEWTPGKNNGNAISGVTLGSNGQTSSGYEGSPSSSNPEYYGTAFKWIISAFNSDDKENDLLRTRYPGSTRPFGSGTKAATKYTYSYYMDFDEYEKVTIPNPRTFVKGDESSRAIGIFVIYDEDPTPPVTSLTVEYSADGENFTTLPGVVNSNEKSDYKVIMPDNAKYAYVRFTKPATQKIGTVYSRDPINNVAADTGEKLLGAISSSKSCEIASTSYRQRQLYTKAMEYAPNTYKIPIINELGRVKFGYTLEDGTELPDYFVDFVSKQPRLTSLTNYIGENDQNVVFLSGAAANNDNNAMTDSYATGERIRTLGNISQALEGASMFITPNNMFGDADTWYTNDQNAKMYSFTADHDGYIYLLSDKDVQTSDYLNNWECVNNGTTASGISVSGNTSKTSRAYNDYTNTKYFAYSFNWVVIKGSNSVSGNNLFRIENPGVDGTTSTTSVKAIRAMNRVYRKHFSAGENVDVYLSGNLSDHDAWLVTWDTERVNGPSAVVQADGTIKVSATDVTGSDANEKSIYTLYDEDGRLIKAQILNDGESVEENVGADGVADGLGLGLFKWNISTMTPISGNIYDMKNIRE